MLFRILKKDHLIKLYDLLAEDNRVVGPTKKGSDKNGKALYAFEEVLDFANIHLDYSTTKMPAKKFFMP